MPFAAFAGRCDDEYLRERISSDVTSSLSRRYAHCCHPDLGFSSGTIHLVAKSLDVVGRVDNDDLVGAQLSNDVGKEGGSCRLLRGAVCELSVSRGSSHLAVLRLTIVSLSLNPTFAISYDDDVHVLACQAPLKVISELARSRALA